jgi:endonuclease/exonuclease/phosphatase family metal-dependent hydrolase
MAEAAIRVACWNLHGSAGPDLVEVAAVLAGQEVDVVCLQEVQRHQAGRLAGRLGFDHHQWWFKHWPVIQAPEGLAVLSRWPFVGSAHRLALRTGPPWSHRRRVAGGVRVASDDGPLEIWVSHLSSGTDREHRMREVSDLAERMGRARTVLAADLNALPKSRTVRRLLEEGFVDVLSMHPGEVPTNWASAASMQPDQRLDYVLASPDLEVVDAWVPDVVDDGPDWRALSDHLPTVATLRSAS